MKDSRSIIVGSFAYIDRDNVNKKFEINLFSWDLK
jgi:hypothetical protein